MTGSPAYHIILRRRQRLRGPATGGKGLNPPAFRPHSPVRKTARLAIALVPLYGVRRTTTTFSWAHNAFGSRKSRRVSKMSLGELSLWTTGHSARAAAVSGTATHQSSGANGLASPSLPHQTQCIEGRFFTDGLCWRYFNLTPLGRKCIRC